MKGDTANKKETGRRVGNSLLAKRVEVGLRCKSSKIAT
jgi:hypothetical protein